MIQKGKYNLFFVSSDVSRSPIREGVFCVSSSLFLPPLWNIFFIPDISPETGAYRFALSLRPHKYFRDIANLPNLSLFYLSVDLILLFCNSFIRSKECKVDVTVDDKKIKTLHGEGRLYPFSNLRIQIMDKYRQEKVQSFEEFIDRQLKPDLIRAIGERDKVFEQQKIYSDLKRNIENLEKNGVTSLHTMVNLGSEVYMQADVPDTRHIFVDVGLGFHVEFTWSEALKFISEKEKRIEMQIEEHTRLIASIKARIKLVGEGIREILQLQAE